VAEGALRAPAANHPCGTLFFCDETRMPVLDPGRGRTKTCQFWAHAIDDRTWGGPSPPAVVYVFADGRGKGEIAAQLVDYTGILQVDGYVAYKSLAKDAREAGTIRLAFCLAHARRKFVKVYKTTKSPFVQEVIERIAAIYAIEERVRGTSAEIRLAARKNETRPLMAELLDVGEAAPPRDVGKLVLAPLALKVRFALAAASTGGRRRPLGVATRLPEGARHAWSSPASCVAIPLASSSRCASDLRAAWRSAGVMPRSRTSSRTKSSWRRAVGGVCFSLGASSLLRASGSSDPILRLLRDDVAVRGDQPRFAGDEQLMQCAERRQ
jgi:hypothetical protein